MEMKVRASFLQWMYFFMGITVPLFFIAILVVSVGLILIPFFLLAVILFAFGVKNGV